MSQRADFRDPAYPQTEPVPQPKARSGAWGKLRVVASRAVFWSYERGSWQYDIIVLLILGFIFITPSSWFHDRPRLQLTDLRHVQGIVELSHDKNTWTFEVDARLVQSVDRPDTEEAIRELLRPRFRGNFAIKSVNPVRDASGVILGYNVVASSP